MRRRTPKGGNAIMIKNDPEAILAADYELIQFDCPCGKHIRATPRSAGKQFQCRKCGATLTVPAVKQEPSSPATHSSPVWAWALALGVIGMVVAVNIASLRPDVQPIPSIEVKKQASI